MKTLLNPWFIAGCIIWLVTTIFRKLHHPLPYVNGYINDAVAVPVIGNLTLCFQRVVVIKNNFYTFLPRYVIFIVAYVSFVFEWLLPKFSTTYTGDWWDVLLYVIGGVFFYMMMNKPIVVERYSD
jgi:hypothetical protein